MERLHCFFRTPVLNEADDDVKEDDRSDDGALDEVKHSIGGSHCDQENLHGDGETLAKMLSRVLALSGFKDAI